MLRPLFALAVLFAAATAAAQSAVPAGLTHQGRLLDANDQPVNDPVKLTFRIYAVAQDLDPQNPTAPLWTAAYENVVVARGLYSVDLGVGEGRTFGPTVFDGSGPRWLGVSVGAEPELKPRLRLSSAAHAFLAARALVAGDAEKLGGRDPAFYLDAANLTGTVPAAALPLATASAAGALAPADKQKLDAINPQALLGGLAVTAPITLDRGESTTIGIAPATASAPGSMSAADKAKLDGINPAALLGGLAVDAPLAIDRGATTTLSIGLATTSAPGAMSAADKAKLDGITPNAGVLTGTTRPASAAAGTLFLNTQTRALDFHDGSGWRNLSRPVTTSCKQLKEVDASAPSGYYIIRPNASVGDVRVYCEMTIGDGGWTLVSNRRAGFNNIESCGTNLAEFFTLGCGNVDNISFTQSYALPANVRTSLGQTQVMIVQFLTAGQPDLDDAYIMDTTTDLFPNSTASNNLPVTKVCDVSGLNCLSNNVYFKFLGTGHYGSSYCSSNQDGGGYGGNYGLCHTGLTQYFSSSAYGNRGSYDETKLWNYGTASGVHERIFVR